MEREDERNGFGVVVSRREMNPVFARRFPAGTMFERAIDRMIREHILRQRRIASTLTCRKAVTKRNKCHAGDSESEGLHVRQSFIDTAVNSKRKKQC